MTMSTYFQSFIKELSSEQKQALEQLRQAILTAAPQAEEGISSGVPAFKYKGKYLASINATQNHIALYMMQGTAITSLKDALNGYDTTNVAIRFSPNNPLSSNLVKKLIAVRMQEIDNKNGA